MDNYELKANKFLKSKKIELKIEFIKNDKYFIDDEDKRDIYKILLKRDRREIFFNFGQSIAESGFKIVYKFAGNENKFKHTFTDQHLYNSKNIKKDIGKLFDEKRNYFGFSAEIESFKLPKPPTAYDVLAGLQKYEVGNFQDFCDNFGYSNDSIKALKVYNNVVDEYKKVTYLFTDQEIEKMANEFC